VYQLVSTKKYNYPQHSVILAKLLKIIFLWHNLILLEDCAKSIRLCHKKIIFSNLARITECFCRLVECVHTHSCLLSNIGSKQ
jgi:hypothetical protein